MRIIGKFAAWCTLSRGFQSGGGEITVRKKKDNGIKKEYAAALNHEYSRTTTCSMPN